MTSSDVDELRRVSDELLDAIRIRDRKTLDDLLLGDFVHVDEVGNRQEKETFVSAIEAGAYRIERLTFELISIEQFDRVGVVCGVQHALVRMPGGEEATGRTAFTDVFVNGPRGWRLRVATSVELKDAGT